VKRHSESKLYWIPPSSEPAEVKEYALLRAFLVGALVLAIVGLIVAIGGAR